ncbi:hypothetical protein JCM6882_003825 [Rhodosporidiobolus microsporus]
MPLAPLDLDYNRERMLAGLSYSGFAPDLAEERSACAQACARYNERAPGASRREQLKMLRHIIPSIPSLPPFAADAADDAAQLRPYPRIVAPFRVDYGSNRRIGDSFANSGLVCLDTCKIKIGSHCVLGPNVQLYTASHPVDPVLRRSAEPHLGGPIEIGDDCWLGGQVIVLPNVKIGRGCTVGAGSVVTKSLPPFVVAVGSPARILKKVESTMADEYFREHPDEEWFPAAE